METFSDNDQKYDSVKVNSDGIREEYLTGRLLLFRLSVALLLILSPPSALSQDTLSSHQVTVNDTTCTIGEMLKVIEQQTYLSFSYNTGIINKDEIVRFNAEREPAADLLKRIINDPSLEYKIVGRHLVIYQPVAMLSVDPGKQTDSVFFFEISGRVYDKNSKKPLPFANIYLHGRSVGTIANEEGEFLLKLSTEYLADTMNISYMGYKQYEESVSLLVNTEKNYFLNMDIIPIQEVIIRMASPLNIIRSAKASIRANYPQKPSILTSFYRETVKKGNRYMIVTEAILETYKQGYVDLFLQDQVKIIKGRRKQDISPDDTIMLKLKAGLNTMLLLDVIKYMPDFMNEENRYDYIMADIVVDNERENYAIEFTPEQKSYEAFYQGRIFVDVRDLSISRVEFSIDPARLQDATNLFVLKKPSYLHVRVLEAKYEVAFRKVGGKYYLHYINCVTGFRVRYKKQLFGSVYHTSLEMAVNQIDTVNVDRFRYRDVAQTKDVFDEQIVGYDEAFWGEYNYIRPEDPLEKAIEKLGNAALELLEE